MRSRKAAEKATGRSSPSASSSWDGQRLAAETGLNFQDEPTWRYQYTPGPGGLDDAPLVRVERGLQGTPTTGTYALLRDEMGSVIGVAEEHSGQQPTLLARYLQTPYGKRHVELGPELVKTEYDEAVVSVGGQDQAATAGETVEGALRIVTTLPLAASSLESGLLIEHYDDASSSWQTSDTEELAIGTDSEDPTNLLVMRLAGWAKATRYRVTLTPALTDGFGRLIVLPEGEAGGVAIQLDVPEDGSTPPDYSRSFPIDYNHKSGETLDGAFPGSQTAGFQGLWTDPTTGLAYARNRWYDPHNAAWLSEDPIGAVDSSNLYAFVGWGPQSGTDPMGLYEIPEAEMEAWKAAHPGYAFSELSSWIDAQYDAAQAAGNSQTDSWFSRKWDSLLSWYYKHTRFGEIPKAIDAAQVADANAERLRATYTDVEDEANLRRQMESRKTGIGQVSDSYSHVVIAGVATVVVVADDVALLTGAAAFAKYAAECGLRKGMRLLVVRSDGTKEFYRVADDQLVRIGELRARMGRPPSGMINPQAHHDLPQADRFLKQWEHAGLDIHDPAHGRWIEGSPVGGHQKWSAEFNREWDEFFELNPNATRKQILKQKELLRNDPRFQ